MARPSSVTRFTHATSASSGEKAAGWLLADISRGGAAGEAAAEKVDLPLAHQKADRLWKAGGRPWGRDLLIKIPWLL